MKFFICKYIIVYYIIFCFVFLIAAITIICYNEEMIVVVKNAKVRWLSFMIKFQFNIKNRRLFRLDPTKIILLSFIVVIFGTLLLTFIASNDYVEKQIFTALFTATSATCVTGLVVVDTTAQWSLLGKLSF